MSVPDQNAPDLRKKSSSSIGSASFHFLVQKVVADSMASVTRQILSLLDTRLDNFKKQFTKENSSSVEAAVKRTTRLIIKKVSLVLGAGLFLPDYVVFLHYYLA